MGTVIFSPHAYQKWCDIGYHSKPVKSYTGCLIKNASTHNFFICYPISMNKKPKIWFFIGYEAAINFFFGVIFNG
jgi:hypothetical protein